MSSSYVIPYTKEVPIDPTTTKYQLFMTAFMASEYTNWRHECMSWKETCMIGDWSPLAKLELKGSDVINLLKSVSGVSDKNWITGKAKHIVCPSKRGNVIGEGIVIRKTEDEYLVTGGPNFVLWIYFNLLRSNFKSVGTVRTEEMFIFQIQGPTVLEILEPIIEENIRDLQYMCAKEITLNGVKVTCLRQGMSGNIGFELLGPSQHGVDIYNAILKSGKNHGIVRVGELSKGVNHVEACFPTPTWDYTPDIYFNDDQMHAFREFLGPIQYYLVNQNASGSCEDKLNDSLFNPVELGWSYSLCFDHEFPGFEILKEEKANPKRKVCTLVWNEEDVKDVNDSLYRTDEEPYRQFIYPREYEVASDKVMKNGKLVGISMTRAYSIYFRKMLSLCVLDVVLLEPGTEVEVIWGHKSEHQKTIRATVAPVPYYNFDKKRDL